MKSTIAGALVTLAASMICVTGYADEKPILIGVIAGTTGAYGSTGIAVVNGAQLAVDKINAAGGVLGRKLLLDAHNDNADATLSGQLFAKMVADGAVAIAGSPDTGPVTAELAIRYKIPTIGVVDDGGLTVYPKGPDQRAQSLGLRLRPEHLRLGREDRRIRLEALPGRARRPA